MSSLFKTSMGTAQILKHVKTSHLKNQKAPKIYSVSDVFF